MLGNEVGVDRALVWPRREPSGPGQMWIGAPLGTRTARSACSAAVIGWLGSALQEREEELEVAAVVEPADR